MSPQRLGRAGRGGLGNAGDGLRVSFEVISGFIKILDTAQLAWLSG